MARSLLIEEEVAMREEELNQLLNEKKVDKVHYLVHSRLWSTYCSLLRKYLANISFPCVMHFATALFITVYLFYI